MPTTPRRLILTACLLLSSCGWLMPAPVVRGNKVDPVSLKELVPGTSTKADVSAVIGSPTARDAFDDNTWLYISELTRERIRARWESWNQNVVVINFDDKGVLTNVHQLDKADALPVTVIARTIPPREPRRHSCNSFWAILAASIRRASTEWRHRGDRRRVGRIPGAMTAFSPPG